MSSSRLRGLGSVVVATLVATLALAAPAHAAEATGVIAGTITDNGAPVPTVEVYVTSDDGFNGSAVTNALGQYELSEVPAAESAYLIMIEAPGHPRQYVPGQVDEESATRYSVTAGGRTIADDTLLPTGTISGRFTDSAGNGVAGTWVEASPFDGDGVGVGVGVHTDVDGSYSVAALPGTYRVSFRFGNGVQYAYRAATPDTATPIQVTVGETVTVNDTKLTTGTITGRLTRADGSPAADYRVAAESNTDFGYATTDDNGVYQLTNLLPASYRVYFQLPSGARQWSPQTRDQDTARAYDVTAGSSTTVDEQLLPSGAVDGRFTDRVGQGIAGVQVLLSGGGDYLSTETGNDGRYRIDGVFPGSYEVQFNGWRINLVQYAYGKLTPETADPITVVANQTTTVDDSRLPTGTVRITAKDSVTGSAISNFSAEIGSMSGSGAGGSLILSDIPIGTHTISARANGYRYEDSAATVTVHADQQSEVQLTLHRLGTINTTVTDRATGAPVAGICVIVRKTRTFAFPDGCSALTGPTGAVSLKVDDPGTYNLFVLPGTSSPYGAQWVGQDGGTGDQGQARQVTLDEGETEAVPTVKLDPRAAITGTVTGADGGPVREGTVGIVPPAAGVDTRYAQVAADGTYRIDWLGPYRWPLQFEAADHPIQWSGGVGNRLIAELVTAAVGPATRYDYQLKRGTTVVVTVPGTSGWGRVTIRNSVTGDPIAVVDSETFTAGVRFPVIGAQKVKLEFRDAGPVRWYGGTDFDSATAVAIPRSGSVQVTFPAS
ncbi:carboxypeptidase family protein [Micromonospora pisi]|uniref:Carboxypeptidase family protein n=1 Tax=Micromonospora pisi TaxID=589240 RepID=A0A495JNP7_9ACTN|nr:carboxypeptidase-like regulatory domain-containing protein [Micromonospora pisi]RKR90556.1 carboxypeptidase family protein [Micromonospora pisi]